jgi:hypothetical protein
VNAAEDGVIEIRFLPDSAAKTSEYSLQMTADPRAGAAPFVIHRLRAGQDGYLRVYFPAKQMVGKTWSLALEPTDAPAGSKYEQVFRVRFQAPSKPSG